MTFLVTLIFLVNRQDCNHCRFYLKDTPFQNDTAKVQLFRELTRGRLKFLFRHLSLTGIRPNTKAEVKTPAYVNRHCQKHRR